MNNNKYIKRCTKAATIAAAALMLLTTSSCRRDLWVYQDNYKQVELDIDWRNYFREWVINPNVLPAGDPAGMTVWFFPKDGRKSFTYTTTQVRHYENYLNKGEYDGLVIDYSPAEYGAQEFIGMDYASTAKVQATPTGFQPDSIPELFGTPAYFGSELLKKNANGYYQVASEPENMASDTIHMTVNTGEYDRYIPYEEREDYQQTLQKQLFEVEPLVVPWRMRIRIYMKGIHYLYKAQVSVAGLADGYYLVQCKSSNTPCLMQLDDWEVYYEEMNNVEADGGYGYIAKTFRTWGPMNYENRNWDCHTPQRPLEGREYEGSIPLNFYSYEQLTSRSPKEVRINVKCLLRDRKTIKYFHFDVANLIHVFRNEYALRIDLSDEYTDIPELPFVEAYRGIDIDGVVVPWEDGSNVNVGF